MSHLHSDRTDATRHQPPVEFDALLTDFDDEFDDFLDRHVVALRETLSDQRYF